MAAGLTGEIDAVRRHVNEWGALYPLLFAAATLIAGNSFGHGSNFVKSSPTQYGPIMLGLHLAGFVGAAAAYVLLLYDLSETGPQSPIWRLLSLAAAALALCLAGGATFATWHKTAFDTSPGIDEWLALLFAFFSLAASAIAAHDTKLETWKARLYIVELPLFSALFVVVIGKWQLFNSSGMEFNAWITHLPYYPQTKGPGWETAAQTIRSNLRGAFWFGLSSGVVSFQLITAQVAALGLSRVIKDK